MKSVSNIIDFLRNITLWKTLKIFAVLILISVVYSIAVEANSINNAIVWVKERLLELSWKAPESGSDHYRLKIAKTDLLAEPVVTSLSFAYTKDTNFKLELQDDHSYMFWVQGVNSNGVLSDFSDSTSLFIFRTGFESREEVHDPRRVKIHIRSSDPGTEREN